MYLKAIYLKNPINILTIFLISLITIQVAANELETVTVTASRTPIEIIKTGSSVTILDEAQIKQSQASNLSDLLRSVAGLQVNQQGSRGALTQIRVRGAEANHLLVLIDGIEVNDIAQGGEFNFAHLQTDQIKRIEIVRGPQSALWGSDALAGVINITTLDNEIKGSDFSINTETGSHNFLNTGLVYQYGSDKAQLQASINHMSTDGTNIARQGREDDGYKSTTIAINTVIQVKDRLKVSANLRLTDSVTDFDGFDFFVTGLPIDADNETKSEQAYARISFDLQGLEGKYNQRFLLARTDTDNESNIAGSSQNSISRGTKDQVQYQGNFIKDNQSLTLIAEYEKENYEQRGLDSGFGNPNRDLDLTNKSLAFEYRYNGEAWHFSASLRQDNNSDFDDSTTYRLTANWLTPVENLYVYASQGRASKNPSFTERFGFFDTFLGNPDLEPELSDSWEIGVKHKQGVFNTTLSYFSSELQNEINGFVFDPTTFAFTAANRKEDSQRQGAEIELSWIASSHLSINASYTYLDSSFEDATGKDLDEVRRPRHIASLRGNYHWDKANLNLSINFNGSQKDDFFPPFPASPQRVNLDSYILLNLAGSYQLSDTVQLTARLENALDKSYEEVLGFEAPGFAAYAGIRLNW